MHEVEALRDECRIRIDNLNWNHCCVEQIRSAGRQRFLYFHLIVCRVKLYSDSELLAVLVVMSAPTTDAALAVLIFNTSATLTPTLTSAETSIIGRIVMAASNDLELAIGS